MVYNKFTLGTFFRIALIFGNLLLITYVLKLETRFFTLFILFTVLAVQLGELLYFINKTNRELVNFLETIKDKDLATRSSSNKDPMFKKLDKSFNNVIQTIQQTRIEKEGQFNLLNLVVEQAQIGIILIDETGKIEIMNPASRNILGLNRILKNSSELKFHHPLFYQQIIKTRSVGRKILELEKHEQPDTLISCIRNEIKLMQRQYILVTFQDIAKELEKTEIESWQKLIRTLSHEIMNSVTPITSLTETSLNILENEEQNIQENKKINKLKKALSAIEKRSSGLYDFVNDVRKVIKIPEPSKQEVNLQSLIDNLLHLMDQKMEEIGIKTEISINPGNLIISADQNQVEQVLINLILNGMEAMKETANPVLTIEGKNGREYNQVIISDNGKGIDESSLSKIFIPFFSTKDDGTGIGLSLCRQIMQKHQGKLTVESTLNQGSRFTLWFPVV
jgi:nitrogen fixation/metabolism regulation signal transduction histidine kinase